MIHYPKCPQCEKVIQSGGPMKSGESRTVHCCMIFEAGLDVKLDLSQRVSFCIHPKNQKMRMLKENFEAALRVAIVEQTSADKRHGILYKSTFIASLEEILDASLAGKQITISEN